VTILFQLTVLINSAENDYVMFSNRSTHTQDKLGTYFHEMFEKTWAQLKKKVTRFGDDTNSFCEF